MELEEGVIVAMEQADLREKVVVITGAARGMGRAYAEGFASAGARVVATDMSWNGAADLRAKVEGGGNGLVLEMDVTNEGQIEEAHEATKAKFGTVDVVINNAALLNMIMFPPAGRPTTLETKPENWTRMLDVNVVGPLRVMRAFCQPMFANQRGSVINIVSSGGTGLLPRRRLPGASAVDQRDAVYGNESRAGQYELLHGG